MCLENLSDDDLAREVQAGNRLAMNVLVQRYQHRLFGWLRSRVRNRQDVEDVLQNLWLRVLGTIGNYRCGAGTFFAWLFFQMRSCHSGYLRSRGSHAEVLLSEFLALADDEPRKELDPSLDLLRAEDWEQLQRLLTQLPPEKQQVIHLWFIVGLNGPQIAQLLGIPEMTVHTRKFTALKKLRELLVGDPSNSE